MDIRGRCCPIIDNEEFLNCRARIDTALFHLENDYKTYFELEHNIQLELNIFPIFKTFLNKFNMTKEDILKVVYLFKENYDDEN